MTISFPDSTAGLERKGSECPRNHLIPQVTAAPAGIEQESLPRPLIAVVLPAAFLPGARWIPSRRKYIIRAFCVSQRHLRLREVVEIRTTAV